MVFKNNNVRRDMCFTWLVTCHYQDSTVDRSCLSTDSSVYWCCCENIQECHQQMRRRMWTFYDDIVHALQPHNKVHFAYGKHTCPQLPNETLTIIDSRIGLNSATGSSQDMSQCYCRYKMLSYRRETALQGAL